MNTGFTFGARNPNQPTSFSSFLGPTSTTTANPLGTSTLFSGSTVPATTSSFQFGGTSTASAPIGTSTWPSQPTATSAFAFQNSSGLFSGTNTTAATGTTPSTGLFGTTTPSLGLGLSAPSLTFPASSSTFGALPTTSVVPSLNIGTPATTTITSTVSTGLGGVDFSQVSTDATGSGSSRKSDSKVLKESVLPDPIKTDLDSFRNHVKHQKTIREEISRISSKPIMRVQEETAALKQLLSVASNGVQRNAVMIEKLKAESAQELKNAEIAQRTKDLPPSMQYENTAPTKYFQEVVLGFEGQMQAYRKQIEDLEQHLASLAQPSALMPNELNVIVRRLHETFVALAAQLQLAHESIKSVKEDFIQFRRTALGDTSNVFEVNKIAKTQNTFSNSMLSMGPTPFSAMPNMTAAAMLTALNRTQQPAGAGSTLNAGTSQIPGLGSTSLMSGSSFTGQPGSFGSFGNSPFKPIGSTFNQSVGASSMGEGSYAVQNATFQLQKPPLGNKRGKRWTSS